MKKILSLVLCVLLLFPSCSKETDGTSETDVTLTETAAETNVLTNVFRGTEVGFRPDFEPYIQIDPCYDAETGTVTVFGQDNNGSYFVSFDPDGNVVSEQPLVKGHDTISQQTGVLTPDALYILCYSYDETTNLQEHYIMRYNRADDTRTYSEKLHTLFTETSGFYSVRMAVDPAGYVYIENNNEIVVLDSDLQYSFTVMSDVWIKEMTALSDAVCIRDYSGTMVIDRDTRMLTAGSGLPEGTDILQYGSGDGYDLYYTNQTGLYGYNYAADEQPDGEAVLLCDWQNSNLYADNVQITNIISPDCMVMYSEDGLSLVIYKRADDIDLSEITTLELAYVYADSRISQQIVRFNKENPDIRIITKDYSVYNTDNDYTIGEKKLVTDMLNGICSPDIITGDVYFEMFSMIFENRLYTDLYTFMENDPDIKKDDLLGSIRRMCESDDGALMMLPGQFDVLRTLIAPASLVGERTSWTLTEMLDFIESLPDDVLLMENLTQGNASFALFGNTGYGVFVDREAGTCDFESEDFLRYLRVLKTFPEGDNISMLGNTAPELRDAYLTGGVALKTHQFFGTRIKSWMDMYAAFGTEETVPIGYASTDSSICNAMIGGLMPYVIPTTCEHPEEAWRFLKSIILSYDPDDLANRGYPVLKPQFEQMTEADYGSYFEIHLDGTVTHYPRNIGYNPNGTMRKPGFRMRFDDAEAAKMLDWFDNRIGLPVTQTVGTELSDIINEEISAYLGGIRTAEDCARIIQSRVSIWLAEHDG